MFRIVPLTVLILLATNSWAKTLSCDALLAVNLPDVEITTAVEVSEPAPHCKATGRIGGKIGFSIWLPHEWNGRFAMGGAGGFVGPEDNQALRFVGASVLTRGFATASTDTGHQGSGMDGSWALNDLEAIVNYGHLGMHRAVVISKAVIEKHYGKAANKSFFVGCSNGGRQALQEAQRYPDDFDGIVAGAPALSFSGVASAFLHITKNMYPNADDLGTPVISANDRKTLRQAILNSCDGNDGARDGYLHDPTACEFDPQTLACKPGNEDCLNADDLRAIAAIYDGPNIDDQSFFFGFPYGAEATDQNGWGSWLTGGITTDEQTAPSAAYSFGVGLMRYFVLHDPNWRHTDFDINEFAARVAPVAAILDSDDTDLSAFRAQGGKLLMFHGWADVALSAHMSTDYIDRVYLKDPASREDARLFMMPGVLHCAGGPGPYYVDWLDAIEQWHDSGGAPEELLATHPDTGATGRLCAWPKKAKLVDGVSTDAANYRCE